MHFETEKNNFELIPSILLFYLDLSGFLAHWQFGLNS